MLAKRGGVKMKGYKIFNPDMTCMGMQYRTGQEYKMDESPVLCKRGFHFCVDPVDLFSYYSFDPDNIVCHVEALGECVTDYYVQNYIRDTKHATNHIRIGERITWANVLELVNTGKGNTGKGNTGNMNTGNWNTGNQNTGNCNTGSWNTGRGNTNNWNAGNWNAGNQNAGNMNTGDRNTGDWNTGDRNTGDWNAGNQNAGNWNTGDRNTGDWNTGDQNTGIQNAGNQNAGNMNTGNWNTGNHHAGFFCTGKAKMTLFNAPTDLSFDDVINLLPCINLSPCIWVSDDEMSDTEKEDYPEHTTTGGYLKRLTLHEAWREWWGKAPVTNKEKIMALPNFNADIFREITGIDVNAKEEE
jgi:hypothetical protein